MSSPAVGPWMPSAVESFPPSVNPVSTSAVGVSAAATGTQPSVVRPAADLIRGALRMRLRPARPP